MAYYGPIALMLLPAWWLVLILVGFGAIYWALGLPVADALEVSGSSLLTLGFFRPAVPFGDFIAFVEAAMGLALVALLISYLPTIYGAFSRRELLVSMLEVRRGHAAVAGRDDHADAPSPRARRAAPDVGALGAVVRRGGGVPQLAAGARLLPQPAAEPVLGERGGGDHGRGRPRCGRAVAIPMDVQADLVIRSGYLALRRICDFFRIPFDAAPKPTDATSIDRARFDDAFNVLAEAGVPMVDDRDQAWRDFNGWRVNYDAPLRGLERLTMAPAPWWDRPMRSAYVTDEPMVAETADPTTPGAATAEPVTAEPATSEG